MNDHDSTKIGMILGGMGYSHTDSDKDAEIILINTCTIREKPQHKAISEIGRALKLKRVNPPKIVGICGCVAQQEGEKLINQFPKLDLVFGPDQIGNLPKMISEIMERDLRVTSLDLINNQADYNFVDLVP
ncbi:tRNA (N6-isopentenyl adenosine(37)-C2)-methylthiotransferase MiaB, partial [bacterium]|nr:tRNA (N6-isopentenyl adenosine(37)-C2)-methylthiotransferase MiaB [bacterium]